MVHLVHVTKSRDNKAEDEEGLIRFAKKFNLENYKVVVEVSDSVDKGLMRYAHSVNAGLVAVMTHSEGGFFRIFSTSLSEELTKDSDTPVLTINLHRV